MSYLFQNWRKSWLGCPSRGFNPKNYEYQYLYTVKNLFNEFQEYFWTVYKMIWKFKHPFLFLG